MNLIDAIKSGRPFRRKGYMRWAAKWDGCYSEILRYEPSEQRVTFTVEDILADDWEIREPQVTITKSQFMVACSKVLEDLERGGGFRVLNYSGNPPSAAFELDLIAGIRKALGL